MRRLLRLLVRFVLFLAHDLYSAAWSYWYGNVVYMKRGAKVTVVDKLRRSVVRARVQVRGHHHDTIWTRTVDDSDYVIGVSPAERGITWCWGWEGEKARALRAAAGLS